MACVCARTRTNMCVLGGGGDTGCLMKTSSALRPYTHSARYGIWEALPQNNSLSIKCLNTSWQIDGKKVEAVTDFIFLGSKITADSDCSHEIKRCLLTGRKAMTNLDSVLKSKDITLTKKIHIIKAMVFPVVMHRCKRCIIKKAEHRRIDVFILWC